MVYKFEKMLWEEMHVVLCFRQGCIQEAYFLIFIVSIGKLRTLTNYTHWVGFELNLTNKSFWWKYHISQISLVYFMILMLPTQPKK